MTTLVAGSARSGRAPHNIRARVKQMLRRDRSALIVPLPWAEPVIGMWRSRYDPSAADGMPAHVTVLYPFLPRRALTGDVEDALEALVSARSPFRVALARVGRFPSVLYLAPEPAEPLLEMTNAVTARWPRYRPYGGAFGPPIAHVTVSTGPEPPALAEELERRLPVAGEVRELCLMTKGGSGRWSALRRFPLRGSEPVV